MKILDIKKPSQQNDMPTKIIQENSNYFAKFLHHIINTCLKDSQFPSDLKLADVTLIYKYKSKTLKDN